MTPPLPVPNPNNGDKGKGKGNGKEKGKNNEGPWEAISGGEWEPNQILLQETVYVPSSNPKQNKPPEGG
jgi:hypothetical protein